MARLEVHSVLVSGEPGTAGRSVVNSRSPSPSTPPVEEHRHLEREGAGGHNRRGVDEVGEVGGGYPGGGPPVEELVPPGNGQSRGVLRQCGADGVAEEPLASRVPGDFLADLVEGDLDGVRRDADTEHGAGGEGDSRAGCASLLNFILEALLV